MFSGLFNKILWQGYVYCLFSCVHVYLSDLETFHSWFSSSFPGFLVQFDISASWAQERSYAHAFAASVSVKQNRLYKAYALLFLHHHSTFRTLLILAQDSTPHGLWQQHQLQKQQTISKCSRKIPFSRSVPIRQISVLTNKT